MKADLSLIPEECIYISECHTMIRLLRHKPDETNCPSSPRSCWQSSTHYPGPLKDRQHEISHLDGTTYCDIPERKASFAQGLAHDLNLESMPFKLHLVPSLILTLNSHWILSVVIAEATTQAWFNPAVVWSGLAFLLLLTQQSIAWAWETLAYWSWTKSI